MSTADDGGNGRANGRRQGGQVFHLSYDIPVPDGLFRKGWARFLYPSLFLRYTTICSAVHYNWNAKHLADELETIGFTPDNEHATLRDKQRVAYCFRIYKDAGIEPPSRGADELRVLQELGLVRQTQQDGETRFTLVLPVPGPKDVLKLI